MDYYKDALQSLYKKRQCYTDESPEAPKIDEAIALMEAAPELIEALKNSNSVINDLMLFAGVRKCSAFMEETLVTNSKILGKLKGVVE